MKVSLSAIVQQYAADLRLRNRSPRTIQLYKSILGYLEDYLRRGQPSAEVPISAVTLESARGYITSMMDRETLFVDHPLRKAREQKISPFTVHQHVRILHAFGSWLKKNGYPNQLAEVPYPKLPKRLIDILTEEEIGNLFNLYSPETPFGARWQAMVAFFLQSGVRLSELLGLTFDRLDMDKYRARIIGKGDKERYVPFGTKACQALSQYINLFRPQNSNPQVFLN
jgi:site-specific recombinase XerD